MSIAEIAAATARSKATVRQWLTEYALSTRQAERRCKMAGEEGRLMLECPHHGMTAFSAPQTLEGIGA
jgi:hypothetical protein